MSDVPPRYVEHVGAPKVMWVLMAFLTVSLGVAYLAYVGPEWAVPIFVASTAVGVWWLRTSRVLVRVDDESFTAGRARIPLRHVGEVTVLDAEQTRRLAGVDADARAYLCTRGSTPTAVRVEVDDDADPTPYWLVSTAHPRRLRDALLAARDRRTA